MYVFDNRYTFYSSTLKGDGDGCMSSGIGTGKFETLDNYMFMIYYTVLNGGYSLVTVSSLHANAKQQDIFYANGHILLVYGFEENGDLLVLDSADFSNLSPNTKNEGFRYTISANKLFCLNGSEQRPQNADTPNGMRRVIQCLGVNDIEFPSEPFTVGN